MTIVSIKTENMLSRNDKDVLNGLDYIDFRHHESFQNRRDAFLRSYGSQLQSIYGNRVLTYKSILITYSMEKIKKGKVDEFEAKLISASTDSTNQ